MLSLLILGSGGAIPLPQHTPPAYWLRLDDSTLLVDPGPGALVRLLKSPAGPDTLDAIDTILFSHLHPDHCADLLPLLFALRSPVLPSTRPLQLIGPEGLQDYLTGLGNLYGDWIVPARRPLIITETESGLGLDPGGGLWKGTSAAEACIRVYRADHTENRFSRENLCFRFRDQAGYTLAYSGDSQFCEGLTQAARDVDLLVLECSTPDELAVAGHMTPSQVGRLCLETQPKRTVLTHFYPTIADLDVCALVREHYSGDIVSATDNMVLTVPFLLPDTNGHIDRK